MPPRLVPELLHEPDESIEPLTEDNIVSFADNVRLPLKLPIKVRGAYNQKAIGLGVVGFQPTDEQRKLVYMLRAHGMTLENICQFITNQYTGLGICDDTLRKHFKYEIEMATAEVNAAVSQRALEGALGRPAKYDAEGRLIQKEIVPNPYLIQWWEKTRAGMKEGTTTEHTVSPGTKVTLIIEG